MKVLMGLIIGTVVCALMLGASKLMLRGSKEKSLSSADVMVAIGIGALVGAINCFLPSFVGTAVVIMAPIAFLAMIAVHGFLMEFWREKEGYYYSEMICFVVIVFIIFFVTKAAAIATAALVTSSVVKMLITMIPNLLFVATIGFFLASKYYYGYKELKRSKTPFTVTIVITTILLALIVITNVAALGLMNQLQEFAVAGTVKDIVDESDSEEYIIDDSEDETVYDAVESTEVVADNDTEVDTGWVYYYNLELKDDQDKANDFNFGKTPYAEGLKAADYDQILRDRMTRDVALAAGDVAWLDAIVGTRYLGEFYESCKGDWAKTINLAKERWAGDQGSFYQTLNAFFAFLDTADEVKLDYRTNDLDDQMYMNPYTTNGVPDVIVMTTNDHSGYYLTYVFVIKGTETFEVSYRIDCGYQPTDVEKVMHIKPDDTPKLEHSPDPQPKADKKKSGGDDPKPNGGGKDGDPTPKPDPKPTPEPDPEPTPKPEPEPTPKPDPTPTKKKDPTKGTKTNTEKNDDPGPGPDTNNGKDSKTSTKDQPTNSNHQTYDEYKETIQEVKETNESQKTGSNDNTPSSPAPAETKIDNNGDSGTGNGGINEPTEVSAPATVAETNEPISDKPGEAWGGPTD